MSVLLLLIVSLSAGIVHANPELDSRIQSVLSWLPSDTESISVLRAPITYDLDSSQPVDPESVYQSPFVYSLMINAERDPIDGGIRVPLSDVLLAVQCAGRWNTGAANDNAVSRPLAYILFLKQDETRDAKVQRALRLHPHRKYSDAGYTVSELSLQDEEDKDHPPSIIYKCLPQSGVIVEANDSKFLHTILAQMSTGSKQMRALPDNLPEWKQVNTQAPYWGVRHFQKNDPTSPFGDPAIIGAFFQHDDQAKGITFSYDPKIDVLDVGYLSENPNIKSVVDSMVHAEHIATKWGPTSVQEPEQRSVHFQSTSPPKSWNSALFCVHAWMGCPLPWPYGG